MLREILSDRRLMRYLVLNVIVSVVSALIVMSLWTFFVFRDPPELTILSSAAGGGNSSPLRIAAVVAAGDLQNERVTLEHSGAEQLALAGWRLRDSSGIEFRFPALVLHPGGQVSVYTRTGENTAAELFWDRQVAVWERGEELTLLDANGTVQATYAVP
ncbi:MAG: lamin tail domain-containing protein [Anaerolineales bacterium]|nr:lamin tail domain-containing protein [Anaerolineales bacterium]MCW5838839.1 lamin tail domain-containing protein [Anaerolineales bacterium]MCW5887782.1 lamin tail domain-containing protein [Anaerolineales bacterium]